jgi:hypothetical protein
VPTSSDSGRHHLARAHDTTAVASPPTICAASATASCGYKGSAPLTSSPFLSSSFTHAPPLILLAPCQCRPPHLSPPSAASSGHPLPDRHLLLELHRMSVHLYNPSSSSPNKPSGPSLSLLPARRSLPRTARSSLSSAESTTPRAQRRRVRPPRTARCPPPPLDAAPYRRSPPVDHTSP